MFPIFCTVQVHWLVRDQIKEVEQLKQEHDEIYNQITGGFQANP